MNELFDMASLKRQRDRVAPAFFEQAELALRTEQELIDRLSIITMDASRVLLLGAMSAGALERIGARFPDAQITVADCSEQLLSRARRRVEPELQARIDWVVLGNWSLAGLKPGVELVVSNLYLPLCDDFAEIFSRLHQVMVPGGCLHFSTLGPDAFRELRTAWAQADEGGVHHVLEPPDMHDVGDALVHAGFLEPVMERDNYTLTYSSVESLLADLRNHGVGNGFRERQPGLTGKGMWSRFVGALSHTRADQTLPLTVEVVLGQAWRSDGLSQRRRADGGVGIALESLAASLEKGRNDVS